MVNKLWDLTTSPPDRSLPQILLIGSSRPLQWHKPELSGIISKKVIHNYLPSFLKKRSLVALIEFTKNPFLIHARRLVGCCSLSLGSPPLPSPNTQISSAKQIKIPFYFSDIAFHKPLNINAPKDLFYENEG